MSIEFDSGGGVSDSSPLTYNPISPKISNVSGKLRNSQPLDNVSFDQHKIKLNVDLYHNGVKISLNPYILQVKTHVGLHESSGRFTLLLTFEKRWENFVFPMDYVEISFSRYLDTPPIMMRGFVGNVRRTRFVDGSGKTNRAYTINGENFGKIWSNYYIEYLVQTIGQRLAGLDVDASTSNPKLMEIMLLENYGITESTPISGSISNADFISQLTEKMLNPYIDVLRQITPQIPKLLTAISIRDDFRIVNGPLIQGVNNQNVYSVIEQFGNKPWCEYYIDDFSDGPILFYRNAPFKDEKGNLILDESNPQADPILGEYYDHPRINDTHITEENVGTSDNEVYSYFFTYPSMAFGMQVDPRAEILGVQALSIYQESDTETIYNPHVELENLYRFGFKSMMIASNSIPIETDESKPDGSIPQSAIAQAQYMNEWLTRAFRWGHSMLNGTIKLKGNEHMRVGRYFTQTSTMEEYYIETVDHEITISQIGSKGNDSSYRFETTVGVTRGIYVGPDDAGRGGQG